MTMFRLAPKPMLLAVALLAATLSGCGKATPDAPPANSPPRIEESSSGPISATLTFTPPTVRLDRETLLTIRITSPTNITTALPSMENRVQGFLVAGSYDRQPETRNGHTTLERHVRLTPQLAPRYRLAPLPITWTALGAPREQWFPTRPVILECDPLVKDTPSSLSGPVSPLWIYPDPLTILFYISTAAGFLALVYLAWKLARRLRKAVMLKRMSPRERALYELAELLDQGLIASDRVKEFYFELTMIVRCYIERAHTIRAPEQTTEEFLLAVSKDSRFPPDVVRQLRAFLNAADLVKYAAFRPDRQTVDGAITTARTYIETDSSSEIPTPNAKPHQPFPN